MRKLIAAMFLLAPAAAFAGAYAIPHENARSLALSQADVAAQTGPEAAYQNASALADQRGLAASVSLEMIYNRTTWNGTADVPGQTSLSPHANFPTQAAIGWGAQLPNGMAYGLGLAYLVPGGGSLHWPANWPGAVRILTVDQKVHLLQASAGFQPLPFLNVGASLLYYRVLESLAQQLNFIDTTGNAQLGLAGNAFTFGLSGEIHVPEVPLTIGVDYRHQAPLTLTGNAHFDNVPPTFSTQLQDQPAHEAVTVPNQLFVGAAYDLFREPQDKGNLKVMAAFTLERWIVYKSDTYVGDKGLVINVPRDSRNAQVYRFAAEYEKLPFLRPLTLRLGFERSLGTQPAQTLSPTLSDASSWVISGGAGYDVLQNLRADVGLQYALFDTATATGTEAFPGSYDTHVLLVSAGLTYRFGGPAAIGAR